MGVSKAWIEEKLHWAEQRLMKLSVLKAPEVILENERKLIAQRKGWLAAWVVEHPEGPA